MDSSPAHVDRGAPTVTAIHVAAAAGHPMEAIERLEVVAGQGAVGDRYFGSKHRHVSLQTAADLAAAAAVLGKPIDAGSTRRNVTLSLGTLPTTPGSRLRVGSVELEVVRRAAPCAVMEHEIGPGARAALRRRGGVICRALTSGWIAIGDVVPTLD